MKEILTKCGYRCDLCPAYSENIKSDEDKKGVSENFKRIFGFDIAPDDIECVGCHNEGKQADAGCPVRPCVMERGYESCAQCDRFICDKLKTRTDFIEEYVSKSGKICSEDYAMYVKAYESKPRLCELREKLGKCRDM